MDAVAKKRIMRDISVLELMDDINLEIIDIRTVYCTIKGPKDTPYYGGKWKIIIVFPNEYPFKSPSVGFLDKIYHPNIDFNSGTICLNVLNQTWTPIYTADKIIETFIPQLLTYPNPDDPLNMDAADLLLRTPSVYNEFIKTTILDKKLIQDLLLLSDLI